MLLSVLIFLPVVKKVWQLVEKLSCHGGRNVKFKVWLFLNLSQSLRYLKFKDGQQKQFILKKKQGTKVNIKPVPNIKFKCIIIITLLQLSLKIILLHAYDLHGLNGVKYTSVLHHRLLVHSHEWIVCFFLTYCWRHLQIRNMALKIHS